MAKTATPKRRKRWSGKEKHALARRAVKHKKDKRPLSELFKAVAAEKSKGDLKVSHTAVMQMFYLFVGNNADKYPTLVTGRSTTAEKPAAKPKAKRGRPKGSKNKPKRKTKAKPAQPSEELTVEAAIECVINDIARLREGRAALVADLKAEHAARERAEAKLARIRKAL